MVRPGAKPQSEKSGKGGAVKKGRQYHMYKVYEVTGNSVKRKNKTCPKCSVFMASHSDRWTCGKCGYMEKK